MPRITSSVSARLGRTNRSSRASRSHPAERSDSTVSRKTAAPSRLARWRKRLPLKYELMHSTVGAGMTATPVKDVWGRSTARPEKHPTVSGRSLHSDLMSRVIQSALIGDVFRCFLTHLHLTERPVCPHPGVLHGPLPRVGSTWLYA